MRFTSLASNWFSLAFAILGTNAGSPPVKVALRSSWSAPPLFLEIIESAALENPGAYFPLVDILTNPEVLPSPRPTTPEAIHAFALSIAEDYLSEQGPPTFLSANLALHASTPKIEAFYQYYIDHDLDARRAAAAQGAECGSWVDWYGEVVCDVETLVRLAGTETVDSAENRTSSSLLKPKALPFDHIQPVPSRTLEPPVHTAILYASLSSPNFRDLHSYLLSLSSGPVPKIEYIMRHVPRDRNLSERNILSGYGVSLDLKKMDYLALDDRHGHGGLKGNDVTEDSTQPLTDETDHILRLLKKYPVNDTAPGANIPLTEDELLRIGLQSVQLIRDSSSPLETLKQLSQNFPKYATTISRRVTFDQALEEEVTKNYLQATPGINLVWLNGVFVDEKHMDPYALLRLFRKERSIVLSLTSLGLTPSQAVDLLTHPAIGAAQTDKSVVDGLFDASDRPEEGGVIVWWNDMEKDKKYAGWNPSIQTLLRSRPMYSGQFPNVKLNLFNVVLVLDLSQTSALKFITGSVSNIINRGFPFRFGVVPVTENEDGSQMARLFYYLIEYYGRATTMTYLQSISQPRTPAQLAAPTVDWALVRSQFEALAADQLPRYGDVPNDFDDIVRGTSNYSVNLGKARAYAERLEATLASAPRGHAFFNGKHFDMDDAFLHNMQVEVGQQIQYLQEALYTGELSEEKANIISTYFYDLPTTALRRNRHLHPSGALRFVDLPDLFSRVGIHSHKSFIYPHRHSGSGADGESEPVRTTHVPFTVYIVADLDSEAGFALVKEALDSLREDSPARISFIHNPTNQESTGSRTSLLMSHLLQNELLPKLSPDQLLRALDLTSVLADDGVAQTVLSQELTFREIGVAPVDLDAKVLHDYMRSIRHLVRELQLGSGDHAVIVNGRVVGPIGPGEFVAADFKALLSYELRKRTGPVVEALVNISPSVNSFDRDTFADLVSTASYVVSASQVPDPSEAGMFDAPTRPRVRNYRILDGAYTAYEFGNSAAALYQVAVLLDPLSETAQKWSSLVEWLRTLPGVYVELHLNPSQYTELPLKRFYRYNIIDNLSFNVDGSEHASQALFNGLPIDPIYTLGMDVPPSWLVRPREAMYDLDNIQLGALSVDDRLRGVEAIFDLDFLVVEGHARDPQSNAPPRGVQVRLTNGNATSVDDTQIVATLGYLQFKITPGVFQLEIREGRGRDIFKLESVGNEGWESLTVEEAGNEITLTSFEGLTLYPRLTRKPGMEAENVLVDIAAAVEEPPSLIADMVSRISSVFKPKTDLIPTGSAQADINIFTVASGLLYERFVSIMILSVLRNTNSSVKFWFIENFLSPSFLEFIPHLAEAYGFQYELVTYKWPSWLRPQKEKQRIIWAYKILFLDVLFPMDLKKVIFVDADQIVRADLQELVDLDLQGAPYGYTPMGDDNTDMEGFRFWKTGYWKDFLQGRPYHISALYVIDLVKFRQIAAGDILRQQYHGLSADPNSLANLDQDLPNNLQREVPIYSLHEDWLWCETWCSKDRLHRAKTIDLCQNPLTKEPKLARARAIPEWEEYDSEISRFARKLAEDGLIRSNIAAVDVNILANAGTSPVVDTRDEAEPTEMGTSPTSDSDSQARDEL